MPAQDPATPSLKRGLTARYVAALGLVATLATSSYVVLDSQIRSQEATGAVINVAGKQRMLSQRAPRLLLEVLAAPDAEAESARRGDLTKTLDLMEKDHRGLVDGDAERGLPGEYPQNVADMYHGEGQLDARVTDYVATLRSLASVPRAQLAQDPRLLEALDSSRKALLGDLNAVVGMYESNSEASIAELERTQTALLGAMLLTLGLIGFLLFRPMVARIRGQVDELLTRERDMRLVLDNTHDGLLLADVDGMLQPTRSRAALEWFGEPKDDQPIWDFLFHAEPERRAMLEMGWGELSEGLMPVEVTLDQFPSRLERNGRTYSLDHEPVTDAAGDVTHVLVSASDITETLALEKLERRGREVQSFVRFTLRDRDGAEAFVADMSRLLGDLEQAKSCADESLLRTLHTIKGNAAVYGLDSLSHMAHALEDRVAEEPEETTPKDVRLELQDEWEAFLAEIEVFLSGSAGGIQLFEDEYERFFREVCGVGDDHLIETVRSWRSPRMQFTLQRLERQAHRLASQLGRELEVNVEDHGVRTDADHLSGFWSALVHVLRNAVDHGIETPEERLTAGKPRGGQIGLASRIDGDELVVEVADDGRGIDWQRVEERAVRMGLECEGEDALLDALLHDGLSTREEVTAISGRGVGMAVLRDEVERSGGRIELESAAGTGTTWRFVFPRIEADEQLAAAA